MLPSLKVGWQIFRSFVMVKMEWYWNRCQSRNLAVTFHRGLQVNRCLGVLVDGSETCAVYDLYKMYKPLNPFVFVSSLRMKWYAFPCKLLKRN